MQDDPLSRPLMELGHISLHTQQLSQSMGRLAADTGQVSRDLRHATEVFAPTNQDVAALVRERRFREDLSRPRRSASVMGT
jgi:transcriptional regulator with GAF, ATPase, and Fis domain